MGLVKVEVPFDGLDCAGCEHESSFGWEAKRDYCALFQEGKASGARCVACVVNELRETGCGEGCECKG